MPIPEWFVLYFAAVLVGNLIVVWLVIRRTSLDTGEDDEEGGRGRVRCPECNAENEARFQFCESCLGELATP